uniref:HD domain-containing protein n=1 Tax=Oryza brachyantha TaxID=4533 RepID=J3M469_ORYBR
MDAEVISAGILREALDAGAISMRDVKSQIGISTAHLLHESLRLKHAPSKLDVLDDESASALRKFCLSYYDIRAVILELALAGLLLYLLSKGISKGMYNACLFVATKEEKQAARDLLKAVAAREQKVAVAQARKGSAAPMQKSAGPGAAAFLTDGSWFFHGARHSPMSLPWA